MAKQRMKSEQVKIVTPEFRVAYPAVFEPKAPGNDPNAKKKYSVVMLFQVKETAKSKADGAAVVSIQPLKDLVRAVLEEKYGADRTKWPAISTVPGGEVGKILLPFRDGAEKKDKAGFGDGIIFVNAGAPGTGMRPGIVHAHAGPDGRPAPLTVPSDFYGGCYARAKVNVYWWEYMGKIGVSLGLINIQKLRDGEPLGGGEDAAQSFDAIEPPTGGVAAAETQSSGIGV